MSKLSNSLKALINSPSARPGTVPAPRNIQSVFHKIQQDAESNHVSQPSWVALSVGYTLSSINRIHSDANIWNNGAGSSHNDHELP